MSATPYVLTFIVSFKSRLSGTADRDGGPRFRDSARHTATQKSWDIGVVSLSLGRMGTRFRCCMSTAIHTVSGVDLFSYTSAPTLEGGQPSPQAAFIRAFDVIAKPRQRPIMT